MKPDWERTLNEDVPRLAEIVRREGLEEIEIANEHRSVRLRGPAQYVSPEGTSLGTDEGAGLSESESNTLIISSEHVGVFHRAREGDGEPMVAEKSEVEEGQTIAFIDVLGVEYDVIAPDGGVLTRFHTRDGQPVAYGDLLADLEPQVAADVGLA